MRAIFLDRDGVICRHRPDYVKSWEAFEFITGSLDALEELAALERPVIVVSNQSCIGRGLVTRDTVDDINRRMVETVRAHDGRIDEVFICPHRPDEGCSCRKPGTGMLCEAATKFNVDLSRSWMVGDNITDIYMGQKAGCRTVLVQTGLGETFIAEGKGIVPPPFIARDIREAVKIIIHVANNDREAIK